MLQSGVCKKFLNQNGVSVGTYEALFLQKGETSNDVNSCFEMLYTVSAKEMVCKQK